MGFPVRTKGTGNTEHMFSQWGVVGTGNREQGTSHETPRRAAGGQAPKKMWGGGILKGRTGNREQGTCRVPQVFPEHVPEPLKISPATGVNRQIPNPLAITKFKDGMKQ